MSARLLYLIDNFSSPAARVVHTTNVAILIPKTVDSFGVGALTLSMDVAQGELLPCGRYFLTGY